MILTLLDIIWIYPTIGTIVWLVICAHTRDLQAISEWFILMLMWPLAVLTGAVEILDRIW